MRECFVEVGVRRDSEGREVMVTKTCKEYIAELESKLALALHTLHSHNLSSTDNESISATIKLKPSQQCGRFFLVPKLGWTNEGKVLHGTETGRCVREKDHPTDDGIGCLTKEGWREAEEGYADEPHQ